MMGIAALAMGVGCAGFAQVFYKRYISVGRHRRHLAITIGLFVLAQGSFFLALTQLSIGVVYMSTAITQVLVLAASKWMLGEQVSRHHVQAVVIIGLGLALYVS